MMVRGEWRDALLYLAIALPLSVVFALVTPPFQSPDEVGHYWRATAISAGELVSPSAGGQPGAMIPSDARDVVATVWMDLAGQEIKFDRSRIEAARRLRPVEATVFVHFPAFYTAVPYAPQALALRIGKWVRCSTLNVFYAGRLANAIAGVLLVMLAMRLLPAAAWVFGSIGLTPMFLFLAGSFSADVVTIALAFCATAAALRTSSSRRYAFPVLASLLSVTKPGYALIALLGIPKVRDRTQRAWIGAGLIGVVLGGWFAAATARAAYYPMRAGVLTDASIQTHHVLRSPFRFIAIASSDYAHHAFQYVDHMIGRLGWLDVGLPRAVIAAYVALFLYVALSTSVPLSRTHRALLALVAIGTLLLVSLSQYLLWTPVDSTSVEGLQGRYLIPIAPLVLLFVSRQWLRAYRWPIVAVAVSGNLLALYAVAAHYY